MSSIVEISDFIFAAKALQLHTQDFVTRALSCIEKCFGGFRSVLLVCCIFQKAGLNSFVKKGAVLDLN